MGVKWMALFNILSVILWIVALFVHRKGYFLQGYLIVTFEIIAHAGLSVFIVGWETGFQYYVLIHPVVVFLSHYSTLIKAMIASIYCFSYAAIHFFIVPISPYMDLSATYTSILFYYNYFSITVLLCVLTYTFNRVVVTTEDKLEKERERTNAALIDRSNALTHLNGELTEAADYVRKILPQPVREGSIRTNWRFVPSTSLGGDAFGYHRIDDENLAAYLIDVSGHGVGAALLSISVINVLRSQSLRKTDFKDPGQVLQSLNNAFPSESNKDMFFTMWYGVYNENSRELTYASGGHPPAILFDDNSASDSKIKLLRTPNYVIGGMPESYLQDWEMLCW